MARILIADDDTDVLESMSMQLEILGHDPVAVEDPDDLLQAAEAAPPDLILQDLKMAGISLAGLVANIKTHPITSEVPLVFFSADPRLPQLARKYGAWGYLPKPFTQQQLADLLERFLGDEPGRPELDKSARLGAKEVADLFHDHANTLAAAQNYAQVLSNRTDLDSQATKAAHKLLELMQKLEAQAERLRSSLLESD